MPRNWTDREVAVIGLGKSGEAACALLRWLGARVYASDASSDAAATHAMHRIRALGVEVDLAGHDLARIARAGVVVTSPGVPPGAAPLAAARDAGVEVVSEVELALSAMPSVRYIAVTGTNGKTTVTALVAHLLASLGHDAVAAGNIGFPLSEVALRPIPPRWVALEISSFQLHDTPSIAPTIGLLTNLAPDHLDRYASVAEYYADKAQLFRNADRGSKWVINADDAAALEMTRDVAGVIARFSGGGRFAEAFYDREHDQLILEDAPFMPRAELRLLGQHNVANALAAVLAVDLAERGHASISGRARLADGLRTFHALPHRLEPVATRNEVVWINDSKATNVASTLVGIESMTRPTVLLLGGRHKGQPYKSLAPLILQRCRLVLAYGEAAATIARDLSPDVAVESVEGTFADVMRRAETAARPGDAILLSPACSSYDMFTNYEERGAAFTAFARGQTA
jgi:UDP-N-acetylmuramoylalanine--D-glutamate ligase